MSNRCIIHPRLPSTAFMGKTLCLITGMTHFLGISKYLELKMDSSASESSSGTIRRGVVRKRGRPPKLPARQCNLSKLSCNVAFFFF